MKRSGRSVCAASRVIEIEEVLVASSASGLSTGHTCWKILRLTVSSSVAASMTRSQPASASSVSAGRMRASPFWRSASASFSELT